jgi:hypothetical protein
MSGRPFERGNKAGKGRPPGSRNKKSNLLEMLEGRGEAIVTKGIFMALSGDRALLSFASTGWSQWRHLRQHALGCPRIRAS